MILWPLVALVTVLSLVGAVRYGQPALEHRRHARTLANIARLEIELGIVTPPSRELRAVWTAQVMRTAMVVPPFGRDGVWNRCDRCRSNVRLDQGRCRLSDEEKERCARFLYQRNGSALE